MSTVINGHELADQMQTEIQKNVEKMTQQGIQPGLAALLVGENPTGQTYVGGKERTVAKIGVLSKVKKLSETISEEELLAEIDKHNQDSRLHGILVQLPLPKHIDEEEIPSMIDPKKGVDEFHPTSLGRLLVGKPKMIPYTPYGIMKMFEAYSISLTDRRAVVTGRSNIASKPTAQLLLTRNTTVTIAHSKTEHLAEVAEETDILVVAIGRGHSVTKEFVKPDAIVIDAGANHSQERKLIDDVAFDEVSEIISYITPVPKGVNPTTTAVSTYQTVKAAKKQK